MPANDDIAPAGRHESRHRHRRRTLELLEQLTVVHVTVFVIAATWAFGGQSDRVRGPLLVWGSLGVFITLAEVLRRMSTAGRSLRLLWWVAPVIALNAIVLVSNLNPSLREVRYGAETMLVNDGARPHWPSSARPAEALTGLLTFDAIWFTAFNLALVVRQRRALRTVLAVLLGNAVVLAIFGTVQKLSGATGIYFGTVPTPQKYFFGSFVYHNHWGSFAVLMLGIGFGLAWHLARRREGRDMFHSPAFIAIVGAVLVAATIPLSGSRSTTILLLLLVLAALLHWVTNLFRRRRYYNESVMLPLAAGGVVVLLSAAAIWFVARQTIMPRMALTERQVTEIRMRGDLGSRADLYRNTWRMAMDKPWFGWGMASYPHVFMFYNTQESVDRFPVYYHDAHSDWLQSLAEHGFIGTVIVALCVLLPLAQVPRLHLRGAIPGYLLIACGMIVLYAWVEFPFGNFAVVLCWWVCFFGALQYARLSAVDQEGRLPDAPAR